MSTDLGDCTQVRIRRNELIVDRLKTTAKSCLRSENRRTQSPHVNHRERSSVVWIHEHAGTLVSMSTKRLQSRHTPLTISVDEVSLRRNEFRDGLADVGLASLEDTIARHTIARHRGAR